MQAPGFWQSDPERPALRARLLAPLARLYAVGTARRVARPPEYSAPVPVICVGNIGVGGTGKTPTVMALTQRLGNGVHLVSRGYGGSLSGPIRVDERTHDAADVGDEPLLLSAFAPTWVAKDRAAGVRAAVDAGAKIVILDDGFQNPSVAKSLSIVVVDAERGFGNGRVLPAGPLREPIEAGLARADLVLTIGDATAQARFSEQWGSHVRLPRIEGHLAPLETGMTWAGLRALAFAGIGVPEKFFRTLRALGVDLVRAEPLDDHQPLTDALMARLELEAKALGAQMVTTEKDAVRLPLSFRQKVLTLPVRLHFDDETVLTEALRDLAAPKPQ